jgi:hypothetical protein
MKSSPISGFTRRLIAIVAVATALVALPSLSSEASAQSAAGAKSSAANAAAAKAAADKAAKAAAAQAAAAVEAQKQAEAQKAAAAAAAAKAEAEKQAALQAQAQKAAAEAAAAEKAAEAAAKAEAARLLADAEAAAKAQAEAEAMKKAAEGAKKQKEEADAIVAAKSQRETEANQKKSNTDALSNSTDQETSKAAAAAEKAKDDADKAAQEAELAAAAAARAEAAEQRFNNATTQAEKDAAKNEIDDATNDASNRASFANSHSNNAQENEETAAASAKQAQDNVRYMPGLDPATSNFTATHREWLICGGSYPGWSPTSPGAPGVCAGVELDVASFGLSDAEGNGPLALLKLKVRNLSGLFESYAGSVITGLGLSNIFGGDPSALVSVNGPCLPTDQDCAAQWALVNGQHAALPNGVGPVHYEFHTKGLLGGIASTCADNLNPGQDDGNGGIVTTPVNPNGLYTTGCFDLNSYVEFVFTTAEPIDISNAYVALRAQNGYLGGSTACITDDPAKDKGSNICNPSTDLPDPSTVPEPGTFVLMASGLVGLYGVRRHRRRQVKSTDDAIIS